MFRKKEATYNLRINAESLNLNKLNVPSKNLREIILDFSQNGSKYVMIYTQYNKKPYIHLLGFLEKNKNNFSEIELIISSENKIKSPEEEPEIYTQISEKTVLSKIINLKEKFTLEQLTGIFERYKEHFPNLKISNINLHNLPQSIFSTLPENIYQKIKKIKLSF